MVRRLRRIRAGGHPGPHQHNDRRRGLAAVIGLPRPCRRRAPARVGRPWDHSSSSVPEPRFRAFEPKDSLPRVTRSSCSAPTTAARDRAQVFRLGVGDGVHPARRKVSRFREYFESDDPECGIRLIACKREPPDRSSNEASVDDRRPLDVGRGSPGGARRRPIVRRSKRGARLRRRHLHRRRRRIERACSRSREASRVLPQAEDTATRPQSR